MRSESLRRRASLVGEDIECHRGRLAGDRETLQVVVDTIDAFADAGWPEWIELVLTMDGIYHD